MLMAQNEFQVTVLRKTVDTFHSKHGITITTSYKFFLGGGKCPYPYFCSVKTRAEKGMHLD